MQNMIDNLTNGNLAAARRQARRYSLERIAMHCITMLGWTHEKAIAAASYLKRAGSFQAYCDAE